MPSKTKKQKRFMQMAAHAEGRAWAKRKGVKVPPKSVAREFVEEDKKMDKKASSPAALFVALMGNGQRTCKSASRMTELEKRAFYRPALRRMMAMVPRQAVSQGANRASLIRELFQSSPELMQLRGRAGSAARMFGGQSPQYRSALGAYRNAGTDVLNQGVLNLRGSNQFKGLVGQAQRYEQMAGRVPQDVSQTLRSNFVSTARQAPQSARGVA